MRQLWRLIPSLSRPRGSALPFSQQPAAARCWWNSSPSSSANHHVLNRQHRHHDSTNTSTRIAASRAILLPFGPPPFVHPLAHMEQRRMYSKLKKYKIKSYSSFKFRFKEKANGEYKRWKAGKRHNAHSKTNKQLRELRRPAVVPDAYAKMMKKLNFHGG